MRRVVLFLCLGGALLATASLAAAQARPEPVTRLGDWVEVGPEVFMNIIQTNTIRYKTTHNYDFEDDLRDTVFLADNTQSLLHFGPGDFFWAEVRFGVDFRYQKNLTARVLLESEAVFDGNLIDDRIGRTVPPAGQPTPAGTDPDEDTGPHVERFWIRYQFPGTPITMLVGAHLWFHDAAGVVADDDPGIFFWANLGPQKEWELKVAAIIQGEATRFGLTNDNDNVYYLGTIAYNRRPFRAALDMMYQRLRDNFGNSGLRGSHFDYFLFMPNLTGTVGPVSFLLQPMVGVGSADGAVTDPATGARREFDIFNWGVIAQAEVNLGLVRPVVGLILGSGDDDATDTDLNGFNNFAHNDIGLTGFTRFFNFQDGPVFNDWGPSPARSPLATFGYHTIYNIWNDRLGNLGHGADITNALSNPGTLVIPVGLKIFPLKGHQLNLWYAYLAMLETETVEAEAAIRGLTFADGELDEALLHEIGLTWIWTLSPHFDINVRGIIDIPAEGSKDIASTVVCDAATGARCQGEDPLLLAQIQFRSRF
ncbi:MAG: hypothetical protein KatS3mg131_1840 [Candidatus Tectimicrobiota bacterium]|nr:MAG: hypothetical protein KatS3mg131_1840 [Candidatus Tectomicrobia bacterium]